MRYGYVKYALSHLFNIRCLLFALDAHKSREEVVEGFIKFTAPCLSWARLVCFIKSESCPQVLKRPEIVVISSDFLTSKATKGGSGDWQKF